MKTLSVLCLLLTGCWQVDSDYFESEDNLEEENISENYSEYEDLERPKKPEDNNCPVYYQKLKLNNQNYLLEIPSECHVIYLEKGRPVEDPTSIHNLVIETPYSQQEY